MDQIRKAELSLKAVAGELTWKEHYEFDSDECHQTINALREKYSNPILLLHELKKFHESRLQILPIDKFAHGESLVNVD